MLFGNTSNCFDTKIGPREVPYLNLKPNSSSTYSWMTRSAMMSDDYRALRSSRRTCWKTTKQARSVRSSCQSSITRVSLTSASSSRLPKTPVSSIFSGMPGTVIPVAPTTLSMVSIGNRTEIGTSRSSILALST